MRLSWSNLPQQLRELIRRRLDNHINVLRLCSVCVVWRSNIHSSIKETLCFPLKLPFPRSTPEKLCMVPDTLISTKTPSMIPETVRVLLVFQGWLAKIQDSTRQISSFESAIRLSNHAFPRKYFTTAWNFSGFWITELFKACDLHYVNPSLSSPPCAQRYARKTVLLHRAADEFTIELGDNLWSEDHRVVELDAYKLNEKE
ncbi:unnamed protein product [Ilex paraguariensis]|uniref:F-box domain-containing protein n=1 Tax=Ilex paraguariensis TaxID=185542 RepID=A0ABC8SYH9_9AQUA